jgi:hypothetical protein
MCLEAMLGLSLYSYLYLKLEKMLCLSYYLLCFLSNKIGEQEGGWQGGGGPNNVYILKKCKNNKIKKLKRCYNFLKKEENLSRITETALISL